jgi:hypothetical protein
MIALASVVLVFAVALTTHAVIVIALAQRTPRWRAAVAFVAPPLAPYWAFRARMRWRALLWTAAVLGYVVLRIVARS